MRLAASGKLHCAQAPTIRSPAPSANTISVIDGASDTMRAGAPLGCDAGAAPQPRARRHNASPRRMREAFPPRARIVNARSVASVALHLALDGVVRARRRSEGDL